MVGMNFIFHVGALLAFCYLVWLLSKLRKWQRLNCEINRRHLNSENLLKIVNGSSLNDWLRSSFGDGIEYCDHSNSDDLFKVELRSLYINILLSRVRRLELFKEKLVIYGQANDEQPEPIVISHNGAKLEIDFIKNDLS